MTGDTSNRDTDRFYRRMPLSLSFIELPPETPCWRIELESVEPDVKPLRLDIVGETVIGRGRVGNLPIDLDMNPYGGAEQGVSRRHAMLKPTADALYIIDLGSLNGTQHNGLPLGPGITRPIHDGDSITLGQLTFIVRVIERPGSKPAAPPTSGIDEADAPLTPRVPYSGFR